MSLREAIQQAQSEALKARDSARLSTLRLLWSAIRTEEINQRRELNDSDIIAVVSRQVRQAEDALQDFERAARQDLIDKSRLELDILRGYLPTQLSDQELLAVIDKVVSAAGVSDTGKAIGLVMKAVKGRAEGTRVRELITKKLS